MASIDRYDNQSLLDFGGGNVWSVMNAYEGCQIFGATGSGKTTGSGQEIALGLLKNQFGGLVLTAKGGDALDWIKYANKTKRLADVRVFGVPLPKVEKDGKMVPVYEAYPGLVQHPPFSFNFLDYERQALEKGDAEQSPSYTENLVNLFSAVMEVSQKGGSQQGGQDAYWLLAVRQLLRNTIDLLRFAGRPLSFRNIYDVITSAPTSVAEARSPMPEDANTPHWARESLCWKCIEESAGKANSANDSDKEDMELTIQYWMREFAGLAEETRSVVVSFFTGMADCFLRGKLKELFSPTKVGPQLNPELTHEGKIIIFNLPVKKFNEMGQFGQVLYKFIWQRAVERRNPKEEGQRPVFLWADEAQFFINSNDMLFQTTARSAKVATVYLTQNISNYYAIMPGDKGKAETDSLLGNFQTKIFHANGDAVTNQWAAETIGKVLTWRENRSSSVASGGGKTGSSSQYSTGESQVLDYQILPIEFATLKKGGDAEDRLVEGIIFQGGRKWYDHDTEESANYKRIRVKQNFLP
jgi:hypothetical protein